MSTSQAPNPRDFKTWEDAFQYPVPVVRRLEQQLRVNINENSDKLRTLVGTSYRDLLGTAERIVEMDGQMHSVETRLGDIGHRCNSRAIERIAANHQRNAKAQRDRSLARNSLASNIALLQSCMNQAAHIIKGAQSPLRAAKLLVLARLLYTSATKFPDPPALLENLKTRLASLRRRLLSHIDRNLSSAATQKSGLVDILAAFSLATTSTPTDVLNHFLHVRAAALGDLVESPNQADLHTATSLLITTLKDVQIVFPKQLATLLGRLQDEPILQDRGIRDTPELNLDIYERWIADDVRNFTPWLRHDQLQPSAATGLLKSWASKAKSVLLDGLRKLLSDMQDETAIIALRKDLLARSLSADRKLPGLDPAAFFEDLRTCFIDRLRDIAVRSTRHVTTIVTQFLDDEDGQMTSGQAADLWDPENTEIDVGKGAINFRTLIHNSNHGKGAQLQEFERSLKDWSSKLASFSGTIKAMREDRWNDDLDLDVDDDFEIDSPQDLLAKEDPENLKNLLISEKDKTLVAVYEKVQSAVSSASNDVEDRNRPVFLLRLLREVVHQASSSEGSAFTSKPPSSLFETLYGMLVDQVLKQSAAQRKASSKTSGLFVRSPPTTLWEGTPSLPVQPSPASFRYLHETCKTMKEVGSDLWTPSAVAALKIQLRKTIMDSLENLNTSKNLNGTSHAQKSPVDGEEDASTETAATPDNEDAANGLENDTSTTSDIQHSKLVQSVFDLLYLDKILALPENQKSIQSFDNAVTETGAKAELADAGLERLRKTSLDYYKRTYMLFGLLAVR